MKPAWLALALLASPPAWAGDLSHAWRHWSAYRRVEVPASPEGRLVKVRLDASVYGPALDDLADLRLIDDTDRETPFLIHARQGRTIHEATDGRVVETSTLEDGSVQVVIEMAESGSEHNAVEIRTPDGDFFARVEVAVSDDAGEWRVLGERLPFYRLAGSAHPEPVSLSYPPARSRYLRLRIATDQKRPLRVDRCVVYDRVDEAPELVSVSSGLRLGGRPEEEASLWRDDLGEARLHVSQVRFEVPAPRLHRAVTVSWSEDEEIWTVAARGEIRRMPAGEEDEVRETLQITFPERQARHWQVAVHHGDDPPLDGMTVTLWGTPRSVVFRAEPRRSYRLLYGNVSAKAPSYEIARIVGRAAAAAAVEATLGAEEENRSFVDSRPWPERRPYVVWATLGLVVAALAYLAIHVVRRTA